MNSSRSSVVLVQMLVVLACLACGKPSMDDAYNRMTSELMNRALEPDSVGIDVGAYQGDILADMLRFAPRGEHHAFEPQPQAAAHLRRRFVGKPVVIHECALSDKTGKTKFHQVASNPAYSGIRERLYERKEEVRLIEVRVERMDDALANVARVDLIKIDVEGAELEVLRGARATLKKHRPVVIFEHGRGAAEYYGTRPDQVFALFAQVGYEVNLLERALAGQPAIDRAAFRRQFEDKINYYFVAYPTGDAARLAKRN